jgi:anaerobic selenocysteine-containing dehydrogenase
MPVSYMGTEGILNGLNQGDPFFNRLDPPRHRWRGRAGHDERHHRRGLTDEGYVRAYAVGYDELAERVQGYTPEWASELTGIPAGDIRTLAREYATTQPAMIRVGVAIERHAGGG